MQQHGRTLLFHDNLNEQMMTLRAARGAPKRMIRTGSDPMPTLSSFWPWFG